MRKRSKRQITVAIVLTLVLCFALSGCGAKVTADISSYENTAVKVSGLTDEDFTITAQKLAQMDCVKKSVTAANSKKEVTVDAIGPTLETFLNSYGYKQSDLNSVTFIASDGYVKVFESAFFTTHEGIILSLANGDKALTEEEAPVRIVIPGAAADQWVKGVIEIRFE